MQIDMLFENDQILHISIIIKLFKVCIYFVFKILRLQTTNHLPIVLFKNKITTKNEKYILR